MDGGVPTSASGARFGEEACSQQASRLAAYGRGLAPALHLHRVEELMSKRESNDRERIDTGTDSRYVRRDDQGRFKESDDVGRSLSADRRRDAEHETKKGQGDRGDRHDSDR